jgi:regulatory protein
MPQPLDQAALQELALRYVGKYATTRAKLRTYLGRKLRERGWEGDREPDLEVLGNRFAELGYIDDASYALGQSRSLSA